MALTLTVEDLAAIRVEVQAALQGYDLDHLIQVTAGSEEPTDGSYLDQIMHKSASQGFDAATDSLEAIRDGGNITPVGGAVVGSTVTVYTYTNWSFSLTLGVSLADRIAGGLYFTVKRDPRGEADTLSMLQVKETTGALYLNRAAAVSAAYATLVVDTPATGAITVNVTVTGVGTMGPESLTWEVKKITAGGPAVVAQGPFGIDTAVARATT